MTTPGPTNISPDFNNAAQHDRAADQLKGYYSENLTTGQRDQVGAAVRGQEEQAKAARAAAQDQADHAHAQEKANQEQQERATSFAKSQEDANTQQQSAKQEFNNAAQGVENQQNNQQGNEQGQGSQMVKDQHMAPELNMKGPLGDEVARQVHQDKLQAERNAAELRNDEEQKAALLRERLRLRCAEQDPRRLQDHFRAAAHDRNSNG
jgi:hypothetical protein